MGRFIGLLLLLVLVAVGDIASADPKQAQVGAIQNAYTLCGTLDKALVKKCIGVVKSSTRRFPRQILKFCEALEESRNVIRVLKVSVNSVFPAGGLSACVGFVSDEEIDDLVACIREVRTVKPVLRVSRTDDLGLNSFNYLSWSKLISDVTQEIQTACRGWDHFHLYTTKNNGGTRGNCWKTSKTESYLDWTFVEKHGRFSSGRPYSYPTIAPVTRSRRVTLYHCHSVYYCWENRKDYSHVNQEQN